MPKKLRIEFHEVKSPINEPVTKFGGQPTWIASPEWPISRQTGNPMRFICQIKLFSALFPNTKAQMAYFFLTDEENGQFVDGTYEPDGGENAVILQPGQTDVPTKPLVQGPGLYRMAERRGSDRRQSESCEFAVNLIEEEDVQFRKEVELSKLPQAEREAAKGKLDENKIGGSPVFLQGDEFPFGGNCQLLLQLDACSVPFEINFGDSGVGYAFLNETGDQAKFMWQCC
jgi:uncharacterized protein YwqG